ncbi:MAG TPA: flagellar hook-length control protein FliK [Solirubrobacteraceae bacterium]|nr:flagellar hook-length control protein FliK [Solirubrobacteraceae bacterium]
MPAAATQQTTATSPSDAPSVPIANNTATTPATPTSPALPTPHEGTPQAPEAQAATAATTQTRLTSPSAATSSAAQPIPVPPGATQAQAPAAAPAAASTTGTGTSATRPERGEAASSPNTKSVRYSVAAASTQADALPVATPTPTRGATTRPGALATQLTSATGSARGSAADTTGQPLAASPAVEHATAATASASVPTFASGGGMQDMIDSISATIEVAARQGLTQVRIALHPAELGEIRIHLTQTSDGLLARVTADTPAAAQTLAGARAELHHSLSSAGLSLLRLDIGSSGQSDVGGREGRFPGRSDSSPSSSSAQSEHSESHSETVTGLEGAGQPAGPARGELVDVLA